MIMLLRLTVLVGVQVRPETFRWVVEVAGPHVAVVSINTVVRIGHRETPSRAAPASPKSG
jgi:hypothetical protein